MYAQNFLQDIAHLTHLCLVDYSILEYGLIHLVYKGVFYNAAELGNSAVHSEYMISLNTVCSSLLCGTLGISGY